MKVEQFEDKQLAHFSYAILSECQSEIILVDPARDITPYVAFADRNQAKIIGVIETHPHADFISSHLEFHQKFGATIYVSKLVGADYPHQTFDEGDSIEFGKIRLKALNTPGHSPDSISIVLEHEGKDKAVFTGDTLFIGDCGRPDLREKAGNVTAKREELAKQMYASLREKLMPLDADVLVYPAHGAGSLCGKALSSAQHSTIGAEKMTNWSLQEMSEADFVKELNAEQPFIPKYFPHSVGVNKKGAEALQTALSKVQIGQAVDFAESANRLEKDVVIVDTRPAEKFRKGHLPNSFNIMSDGKFETWLGSIVAPGEMFYLAVDNETIISDLLERVSRIGYEPYIKEVFVLKTGGEKSPDINVEDFKHTLSNFTIVDIRNVSEVKQKPIFTSAINIPLPELRERLNEIPTGKPIVVHCAGGYRSAAGSSIIQNQLDGKQPVLDLSTAVKDFEHAN